LGQWCIQTDYQGVRDGGRIAGVQRLKKILQKPSLTSLAIRDLAHFCLNGAPRNITPFKSYPG